MDMCVVCMDRHHVNMHVNMCLHRHYLDMCVQEPYGCVIGMDVDRYHEDSCVNLYVDL